MHVVIIGNGISGVSVARHVRKLSSEARITMISAETKYHWSRTALMYIYMGHMTFENTQPYEPYFWPKNRINLLQKYVSKVDPDNKFLHFTDGDAMPYDKLVLATGSQSNKFGWPGQDLAGVQGMVSFNDLQSMEVYSRDLQHAVVVGGGLIGIEMAEMFHSRHIPVTLLVRETSFWNVVMPPEESAMINREIDRTHGIDLRLQSELKEILPDENGRVSAIITKEEEEIPCQFVGLTAGVHPNIDLAKDAGIETQKGFLVDEFLQTSQPDIYAVGDCAQLRQPAPGRRPIEAVWYTGRHMGPDLARILLGENIPYVQRTWFNSAKFINLEYQVYGEVANKVKEGEQHLYWEHPTQHKSVRIVYDADSKVVKGFNLMGVRYRADICLKWIDEGAKMEEVLNNLGTANFDPEFFKTYEGEIVRLYNEQNGTQIKLKRKKNLKNVFAVLNS